MYKIIILPALVSFCIRNLYIFHAICFILFLSLVAIYILARLSDDDFEIETHRDTNKTNITVIHSLY